MRNFRTADYSEPNMFFWVVRTGEMRLPAVNKIYHAAGGLENGIIYRGKQGKCFIRDIPGRFPRVS